MLCSASLSLYLSPKQRVCNRTAIDGKRVSAHNARRYMATTQLAGGRSPLDVQRQMGHTTLHMTNKYASLTIGHLKKSHERHSPLRADTGGFSVVVADGVLRG